MNIPFFDRKTRFLSIPFNALLPATAAFLLYLMTVGHGFVLDDNLVITTNAHIKEGLGGIGDLFRYNYAHGHDGYNDGLYRPLSLLTFAMEQALFGLHAGVSHAIQALLYALTVFLITRWLAVLCGSHTMAFWVALLFALHPIHTEVAANLKSRDEIMALLFFAGAALAFTQWLNQPAARLLTIASVCFAGALFSKESAVTFAAVFPLIGWMMKKPAKRVAAGAAAMLVPVAVFLLVRHNVLNSLPPVDSGVAGLLQNSLTENDNLINRIATAATIQGIYLQKLFVPFGLSHDYSYNAIPVVGLGNVKALLWLAVNVILIALGVHGMAKRKLWSFGILFYYITITVVANVLILIGAMAAERFVFAPSLGWCVAVVAGVMLLKTGDKPKTILLAGVCVMFLVLSALRIPDWKSNYALFTADVETVPTSARAHYNAGTAMTDAAKVDRPRAAKLTAQAQAHLRKATEIWPDYQDAYNNLGISHMNAQEYEAAHEVYTRFIQRFPNYTKARYNMAVTCHQLKRYDEAETHFEAFLNVTPNHADALYFCAESEGYQGKFTEAIAHLEALVGIEPNVARGFLKLGMAHGISGNMGEAENLLLKAVEMAPNDADTRYNLAVMYATSGRPNEARAQLQIILQAQPNHERAIGLLKEIRN